MASQLWQRLREARKFANVRQADMAKAAGVTRSGYAFWETKDDASRTRPNVEQMVAISNLTKVPVAWLMDDNANVNDLWRGGKQTQMAEPSPTYKMPAPAAAPSEAHNDRALQRFWAAVEYAVTDRDPSRDQAFGVDIGAGAVPLRADYIHGQCAAMFVADSSEQALISAMGRLVLVAIAAKIRAPSLAVLVRADQAPEQRFVESAGRFLGVRIAAVASPAEAADILLSV